MTRSEFVESAALYVKVPIESFSPPDSITRMCEQPNCKRQTTWLKGAVLEALHSEVKPTIRIASVAYQCGLCKSNSLEISYEMLGWRENPKSVGSPKMWHHTAVRKVGQIPPPLIEIASDLVERLGTAAEHYKKALVCRGQGYGIGAMAYLRRVIDEKTDDLIEVMAKVAESQGVSLLDVETLRASKKEFRFDQKLAKASELIPASVRPGGVNPLGQLYKYTSIGLHHETDDRCVEIFDELRADFEFVFKNLHNQAEEQRAFARRVQTRSGSSQ